MDTSSYLACLSKLNRSHALSHDKNNPTTHGADTRGRHVERTNELRKKNLHAKIGTMETYSYGVHVEGVKEFRGHNMNAQRNDG